MSMYAGYTSATKVNVGEVEMVKPLALVVARSKVLKGPEDAGHQLRVPSVSSWM
jgi:hypothetical protein